MSRGVMRDAVSKFLRARDRAFRRLYWAARQDGLTPLTALKWARAAVGS